VWNATGEFAEAPAPICRRQQRRRCARGGGEGGGLAERGRQFGKVGWQARWSVLPRAVPRSTPGGVARPGRPERANPRVVEARAAGTRTRRTRPRPDFRFHRGRRRRRHLYHARRPPGSKSFAARTRTRLFTVPKSVPLATSSAQWRHEVRWRGGCGATSADIRRLDPAVGRRAGPGAASANRVDAAAHVQRPRSRSPGGENGRTRWPGPDRPRGFRARARNTRWDVDGTRLSRYCPARQRRRHRVDWVRFAAVNATAHHEPH
jgi:hypothetical protein